MGPRRKSLNFLTLKKTKNTTNENNFLHCVSDFNARVCKRKSTSNVKTTKVKILTKNQLISNRSNFFY